jgi:hypothetical protein
VVHTFKVRRAAAVILGAAVLASTALVGTAPALLPASAGARDAQTAILSLFDRYEVVAADSPDEFYLNLIGNRAFPSSVNDIAVECGNSLYQPILDRYIADEDVPLSDVRQVWRNTTQPMCGFSTFYERLFPLVRRINEKLPPARRLRVLACDPPIDWGKVHNPQDRIPFMDRDASIANVMKTQVLTKHRKALMLFGIGHLLHGQDTAVGRYERDYPNVTFTIVLHLGFAKGNDLLEKRMASWPVPALASFNGTWLGTLPSSYFNLRPPGLPTDGTGYPGADGYLYLGPRDHLLREPLSARTVLDATYITELQRRADAVNAPPDSLLRPQVIFQNELQSSVLQYDPEPMRRHDEQGHPRHVDIGGRLRYRAQPAPGQAVRRQRRGAATA